MKLAKILFTTALCITLAGCASTTPVSDRNSDLTHGNVQMNLVVGQTTKADVLESFGSPNIMTRDGGGQEVWTYQRSAQVSESSTRTGYWTVVLAGGTASSSGFQNSSRMITLIIKFDEQDIVSDFRSRTSSF